MDRFILWEMSQIRRRELLELAGVVRHKEDPRKGSFVAAAMTRARQAGNAVKDGLDAMRQRIGGSGHSEVVNDNAQGTHGIQLS